jgi:hypothetical protein
MSIIVHLEFGDFTDAAHIALIVLGAHFSVDHVQVNDFCAAPAHNVSRPEGWMHLVRFQLLVRHVVVPRTRGLLDSCGCEEQTKLSSLERVWIGRYRVCRELDMASLCTS